MFSVSVKRSLLVTLFLALTIFVLSAPVDAASVTPSKQLYAVGEPIVISFADFPGHTSDWITIVPVGATNTAWGHWRYTQGGKSGSINFNGQSAGEYEARGYFNYSGTGSYVIQASARFSVR
jgi:hypothetical protein